MSSKNLTSFGFIPDAKENCFDITFLLENEKVPSRKTLALAAVKWISENKNRYTASGAGLNKIAAIENSLQYELPEQADALSKFHADFINNPYICENCITADNVGNKITACEIQCYMVNLPGISIPLGIVKSIWGEQLANKIISEFMLDRNDRFYDALTNNINYGKAYSKSEKNECKLKRELGFNIFLYSITLLLATYFVVTRLFLGVDFSNIGNVVKQSASMIQAAGFLTEVSYGINHNSILCFICLLFAVLWFIRVCCLISPFKHDCARFSLHSKRTALYRKCTDLLDHLAILAHYTHDRIEFINSNAAKIYDAGIEIIYDNPIPKLVTTLNKTSKPADLSPAKSKLPNIWKSMLYLLFAILTVLLSFNITNSSVNDFVNTCAQTTTSYFEGINLFAYNKYTVSENTAIYSKESTDSLKVYNISPGEYFRILGSSSENDDAYLVKIFTEYGYISGWLIDVRLVDYSPTNDSSVFTAPIANAEASSTGAGTVKSMFDGKSYTRWGEGGNNGGVGEYVDMNLENVFDIKTLMIQSGNCYSDWLFTVSNRPIKFTAQFYVGDVLNESVSFEVANIQSKQYLHLTRPVQATKVRLIIDGVTEGSIYKKAFITELALYGSNQD